MAAVEAHRSPFRQLHDPGNETSQHLKHYWTETSSQGAHNPFGGQGYYPMSSNQSPHLPVAAHPAPSSVKKRKATKPKPIGELRRVASLPQVRGLPMADQIPPSPTTGDKRRSKLGYHRINVACGHCRRRKIRCVMPAPEDHVAPQDIGRCSNCIRLKKTCEFLPVPESGSYEPKARKSGPPSASNPSSPSTSGAHAPVSQDEHERSESYSHISKTDSKGGDEGPMDSGFNGVPLYHEQQHYAVPTPVITTNWQAEGFASPTSYSARQSPPSYWSPSHPAQPAGYPQANIMSNIGNSSYNQPSFTAHSGVQAWPQQQRSLSLGHVDPNHQPYQYPTQAPYSQIQQPGQETRQSYANDPNLHTVGAPPVAPAVAPSPQVAQPYQYQNPDWQRYQMASAPSAGTERTAYPYQHQTEYYPPPAGHREDLQPPVGGAYPQQPIYYPPTSRR